MFWIRWAIYSVAIVAFVLITVMVFIYMERRVIGKFQLRLGPNRVGPFGALQPIADAIKVLVKEDIIPDKVDRWVHWLAPVVVFVPALLVFAVIPFQGGTFFWGGPAVLANLDIGILYIVAISSISVVGVFMAGWGSNNKYSLLGAMRGMAQMVSYEVPLVLSILGVVMIAGSLSLVNIVEKQQVPFILLQPLGFIIYFMAASAELNRSPFDLLEAESEIVAGYHTEYSGMKFALFFLGEYAYAVGVSAIISLLFLGGWKFPWGILPASFIWFVAKVLLVFFLFLWVRSTLPRVRVDQLMGFAWKFLLPLSLANLFIVGVEAIFWPRFPWPLLFLNIALAVALIYAWSRLFRLGGGKVAA